MDYDEIDRNAGGPWVVFSILNGTRLFLSVSGAGTDIKERAQQFNNPDDAKMAARRENLDHAWRGQCHWTSDRLCAF